MKSVLIIKMRENRDGCDGLCGKKLPVRLSAVCAVRCEGFNTLRRKPNANEIQVFSSFFAACRF